MGGLQDFSVSPNPLGTSFGPKGLGTGLDNNTCTMSIQMKVDVSKDDIRKAIVDLPMDKNYKISCQVSSRSR